MDDHVERAAHEVEHSDALDQVARVGLVTYGLVHLLIGWLALQLAVGDHDEQASANGALHTLAQQPFGKVLVLAVAIGMFLLAAWQLLEAALGHRDRRDGDRTRQRLSSLGKAVVYAGLGGVATKVVLGAGSSRHEEKGLTAQVMSWPGGQWLVVAAGAVVLAIGVGMIWQGATEGFARQMETEGKLGTSGAAYLFLGRIGHLAKGLAFLVVGGLVGYAGLTHDPKRSGGLDEALQKVLQQPFGPYLLVGIAVGIGCYGLFCFAQARHLDR